MRAQKGWMSGRHWAVMFKCSRCGHVATTEYDGENENLQCQRLPDGWGVWYSMGFSPILCPECNDSYKGWMEGK